MAENLVVVMAGKMGQKWVVSTVEKTDVMLVENRVDLMVEKTVSKLVVWMVEMKVESTVEMLGLYLDVLTVGKMVWLMAENLVSVMAWKTDQK
jgi:hypothetical protein